SSPGNIRKADVLSRTNPEMDSGESSQAEDDMSLYKRGGVYWASFYVESIRHQRSTGSSNRRNAETIARRLKEQANLERFQIASFQPELTFRKLAAMFTRKGVVRQHHQSRLKMLIPYFGEIPVGRIDKGTVVQYRKHRHEQKQVTDATINRDIEVLRHILYW